MNVSQATPLSLADRCRSLHFLVLDVDGVLTRGGITYTGSDISPVLEAKEFHVRDGLGLKAWANAGKESALLTSRWSRAVEVRAAELGITTVLQGVADKAAAFDALLTARRLNTKQVVFIGDDLADVPVLCRCGLAVAVADACPDARAVAHYVTRMPGGAGAVREVLERVLRCQGLWSTR